MVNLRYSANENFQFFPNVWQVNNNLKNPYLLSTSGDDDLFGDYGSGDWALKEKLPETKNWAFLMFSTEAYLAD